MTAQETRKYGEFQKHLAAELDGIREAGFYKTERVITTPQGSHVHVATGEDLSARPEVIDWVKSTYSMLEQAADSGSEPDREGFDAIRARQEEANRAYGPVLAEVELDAESKQAEVTWVSEEFEKQRRSAESLAAWTRHLERSWSWRMRYARR